MNWIGVSGVTKVGQERRQLELHLMYHMKLSLLLKGVLVILICVGVS